MVSLQAKACHRYADTGLQASSSPFPHRFGTLVPQHDLALLSPSRGPRGFFNSPGHREGSSAPQTATTGRRAHGVGVRLAAKRQGDREQGRRHEELEEGKGSEVRGALGQGAGGGSGRRQDWDYGDRWHEGIWHGWSQRPEGKTGPLASPRAWRPRSNCSRRQPLYTNSSLMSYSCANMKETS